MLIIIYVNLIPNVGVFFQFCSSCNFNLNLVPYILMHFSIISFFRGWMLKLANYKFSWHKFKRDIRLLTTWKSKMSTKLLRILEKKLIIILKGRKKKLRIWTSQINCRKVKPINFLRDVSFPLHICIHNSFRYELLFFYCSKNEI